MSGGRFDYLQFRFTEIVDAIEKEIEENNKLPMRSSYYSDSEPNNFSEETLAEFRNGIDAIKKAQIYAHRIDWLLSGDDNEETFHKKLAEGFD